MPTAMPIRQFPSTPTPTQRRETAPYGQFWCIGHAGYLWAFVNKDSVKEAAVTYARQLILCCETLMTGTAPKKAQAKA